MSDQPLVPLIVLLVVLVVVLQFLRPGIVNERWIANTIKFAIPLAILAGCQTHDHADRRHRPLGRHGRHDGAFIVATQVGAARPGGRDPDRARSRPC